MIGQVFKLKGWQYGQPGNRFVIDKQTGKDVDVPIGSSLILTEVTKHASISGDAYWAISYDFLFGAKVVKLVHTVSNDKEAADEFIKCFDKLS